MCLSKFAIFFVILTEFDFPALIALITPILRDCRSHNVSAQFINP